MRKMYLMGLIASAMAMESTKRNDKIMMIKNEPGGHEALNTFFNGSGPVYFPKKTKRKYWHKFKK